jgi:hypothetical protein
MRPGSQFEETRRPSPLIDGDVRAVANVQVGNGFIAEAMKPCPAD